MEEEKITGKIKLFGTKEQVQVFNYAMKGYNQKRTALMMGISQSKVSVMLKRLQEDNPEYNKLIRSARDKRFRMRKVWLLDMDLSSNKV